MKKRYAIALLLIFSAVFYMQADDLIVEYLDGYLEVKTGDQWEPIDIGDTLEETSTIRLSEDGYAEIFSNQSKITLDRDGVYDVESLIGHISNANKWGIKGSSFAKLFKNDELDSRQSAVMGVRGDPQDEEEITWVDDDVEFLEEGKALYLSNDFDSALDILEEGAEWYGSNYEEILFYKALCEYETGNLKAMRNSLFGMEPDPDAEFFGDYVLLKGNLLIESRDFETAEKLFGEYLNSSTDSEIEQNVYILSAFCSLELNDRNSATQKLRKAMAINSNNEIGKKANQILSNL